jgi:hypothetical protein
MLRWSVKSEQRMTALGLAFKCTLMKTTILRGRQILMLKTKRFTHVQGILSPAPLTYWRTREEKTKNIKHVPILVIKKNYTIMTYIHIFCFVLQQILSASKIAFQMYTCPCGWGLCIVLYMCAAWYDSFVNHHHLAKCHSNRIKQDKFYSTTQEYWMHQTNYVKTWI